MRSVLGPAARHEGRSLEVEAEMRAPDTMRKLRRLAEAGLIGMHFGSP